MLFGKKYRKILIVEGMKCGHCSKKVEEALKKVDSVTSVKIDLDKKEVVVICKEELDNRIIVDVITSLDYNVVSID